MILYNFSLKISLFFILLLSLVYSQDRELTRRIWIDSLYYNYRVNNADDWQNVSEFFGDFSKTGIDSVGVYTALKNNNIYNVKNYGAIENDGIEDTKYIQQCLDSANTNGGIVYVPQGEFIVDSLIIYNNTILDGVYGKSILKGATDYMYILSINPDNAGYASADSNERNIIIKNIAFEGTVLDQGFSEHRHSLNINAATNVLVENCIFTETRGDAIYLGSSNDADTERHNEDITIRKCRFMGTDSARNGISIIDGRNIQIENNYFYKFSRAGMPGAIDIEPNSEDYWARLEDITIKDNTIESFSNSYAIACVINEYDSLYLKPQKFRVINNFIRKGTFSGSAIYFKFSNSSHPVVMDTTFNPHDVIIKENTIDSTVSGSAINIQQVHGIKIIDNTISDGPSSIVLGSITGDTALKVINCKLNGNYFYDCGNSIGNLILGNVDILNVSDNVFMRMGRAGGIAIHCYSTGAIGNGVGKNILIHDNYFSSDYTYSVDSTLYTFTSQTNRFYNNIESGTTILNNFVWDDVKNTLNAFNDSTAFSEFRVGREVTVTNSTGLNLPGVNSNHQGILETLKYTNKSGYEKFATQLYYPAGNVSVALDSLDLKTMWIRKSVSSSAWGNWYPIGHGVRRGSGDPNVDEKTWYIGETYFNTADSTIWMSIGVQDSSWVQLSN